MIMATQCRSAIRSIRWQLESVQYAMCWCTVGNSVGGRGPVRNSAKVAYGSKLVLGQTPLGCRECLPLYWGCGPCHRQSSGRKAGHTGIATCRVQAVLDHWITVVTWCGHLSVPRPSHVERNPRPHTYYMNIGAPTLLYLFPSSIPMIPIPTKMKVGN